MIAGKMNTLRSQLLDQGLVSRLELVSSIVDISSAYLFMQYSVLPLICYKVITMIVIKDNYCLCKINKYYNGN